LRVYIETRNVCYYCSWFPVRFPFPFLVVDTVITVGRTALWREADVLGEVVFSVVQSVPWQFELSISTIRIVHITNAQSQQYQLYWQFELLISTINCWYLQFELLILTINCRCWYQQFQLLISAINCRYQQFELWISTIEIVQLIDNLKYT